MRYCLASDNQHQPLSPDDDAREKNPKRALTPLPPPQKPTTPTKLKQ